jgi:hypothetical protein
MADRTYRYYRSTDRRTLARCLLTCEQEPGSCRDCPQSEQTATLWDRTFTEYDDISNEKMDELEAKVLAIRHT